MDRGGVVLRAVLADLEHAVPVLEEAADHEALAYAEMLRFQALDRAGLTRDEGERFSLALEHARRTNARHLEDWALSWICITLHRGTVPVEEAIARATEIFEGSTSTYVRTSAVGAIGLLRAMKGEFEEARAIVEEVRRALDELGLRQAAAAHSIAIAEVEALAGDDAPRNGSCGRGSRRSRRSGTSTRPRTSRGGSGSRWPDRGSTTRPNRSSGSRSDRSAGFWVDVWWRVVLARSKLIAATRSRCGSWSEALESGSRCRGERHARGRATRGG